MEKGSYPAVQQESENRPYGFLTDLKSLLKAGVLLANVLPVFTGFWLALYFTELSFAEYWTEFIVVMAGSTSIMAGALMINNWYDVDIDTIMART